MAKIKSLLGYSVQTRRSWWYTASSRTRERFSRTVLGSFWLGFSNLLSILSLGFVYGNVFKVENFKDYFLYLGLGLVIWNSIAISISSAPTLFKANAENIKNSNIHPIFYTLEEWAFQIQTFLQSFSLVFLVLGIFNHQLFTNLIHGILPVINLLMLLYWLPLLLCILGARFDDLNQLIPVALQLIFLLSPILYDKKNLSSISWSYEFNPLYQILSSLRDSLIFGTTNYKISIATFFINIIGVLASIKLLEKNRYKLPFYV